MTEFRRKPGKEGVLIVDVVSRQTHIISARR
jgi:hypothetical protein